MKKRIPRIPVVSAVGVVLLVAIVGLRVRSPRHADLLMFYTPAGHLEGIASDRTGLLLCATEIPFGSEMRLSAGTMSISPGDFAAVHELIVDAANERGHFLGFHAAKGRIGQWGWKFSALVVPYWAPLIPLVILPLTGFRRVIVRTRRKRRRRCVGCGYDLRQSPERCPECGRAVGAAADGSTPSCRRIVIPLRVIAVLLTGATIAAGADLFFRGTRAGARAATDPPERAILDRSFSEVRVRNRPLDQFIPSLAEHAGASAAVDWAGLEISDRQRAAPVTLDLHAVKLTAVLDAIREDGVGLAWQDEVWVDGGSIHWGPAKDSPIFVRSYPVGDLLSAARSTHLGPGDSAFQNDLPAIGAQFTPDRYQASEAESLLSFLIEDTVRVDEWRDSGGANRDLRIIGDRLWVLQSQEGHAAVRALLAALRRPAKPGDAPELQPFNPHANLDQSIPDLNVDATLEGAINAARDATQANIVVCWADLEAAGVERQRPVKLHLRNVTLGSALDAILRAGTGDVQTISTVRDGIILVGSADHLRKGSVVIRTYDVKDLTARYYARHPPTLPPPGVDTAYDRWQTAMESIIKPMENIVDPDSWVDNGGFIGRIRAYGDMLVITQMPPNQRKVAEFLQTLQADPDRLDRAATKP